MSFTTQTEDRYRTAGSLIRDLERLCGVLCVGCSTPLNHHQVLMAVATGFKDAPRCVPCLAAALDRDPAQLRDSLFEYIRHLECYAEAWNWANRVEQSPDGVMPVVAKLLIDSEPDSHQAASPGGAF
ncbi:MAG: hypothetical protein EXS31_14705 [Pedosphaera sp.]|nr:hypothetical protein [Pedosphaera sp.]